MKQTKYFCDRCKQDCKINGEKDYPGRIMVDFYRSDLKTLNLELCENCFIEFYESNMEWIRNK